MPCGQYDHRRDASDDSRPDDRLPVPRTIHDCIVRTIRPLDESAVARVLAGFHRLNVERRDGYLVNPWHNCEDSERGEAFAARLQAEAGCLIADRRNGRIVDLGKMAAREAG